MAANLAAQRAALQCVGFAAAVVNNITDVENIDPLEELKLNSSDDVETLCQTIRSPGGLVNNPNAGMAGQPQQIRNPAGRRVSACAEKNLKLTTYFLHHQDHISRTVQAGDITLLTIRPMTGLTDREKAHTNPDELQKYEDQRKMVAFFLEIFQNYLTEYHGKMHVPLTYLICNPAIPAPAAINILTNYQSIEEEMITRAPHAGPPFISDNRKLWELDTDAYKYIKLSACARARRGAWTSLTNHLLGKASLDNLTARVERAMMFYTGKKRCFDLTRKYCGVHKDAHNNTKKAHEQMDGAYPMMDEMSKVCHLLDGIHTKTLDAAKAAIFTDPRI
jgi:hypothetical protein